MEHLRATGPKLSGDGRKQMGQQCLTETKVFYLHKQRFIVMTQRVSRTRWRTQGPPSALSRRLVVSICRLTIKLTQPSEIEWRAGRGSFCWHSDTNLGNRSHGQRRKKLMKMGQKRLERNAPQVNGAADFLSSFKINREFQLQLSRRNDSYPGLRFAINLEKSK